MEPGEFKLKAENLKSSDQLRKTINYYSVEIQREIVAANKLGKKWLNYHGVPTTFDFQYMNNKDVQIEILAGIIKPMKKNGFNIKIDLTPQKCILRIHWYTIDELDAMKKKRELVASAMKSFVGPTAES